MKRAIHLPAAGLFAAVAVALALAACSQQASLLNSERIEATFGSYGVEILASVGRSRVTSLYSVHGDRRVCRTFAVVSFPEVVDPRLAGAHREVLAGSSIGATLRAAGWSVEKEHLFLGTLPAEDRLAAVYQRMNVEPAPLAVHVYRLTASRPGLAIAYATIAEVHHPEYLDLSELRSIYDPAGRVDARASPEVAAILDAVVVAASAGAVDVQGPPLPTTAGLGGQDRPAGATVPIEWSPCPHSASTSRAAACSVSATTGPPRATSWVEAAFRGSRAGYSRPCHDPSLVWAPGAWT